MTFLASMFALVLAADAASPVPHAARRPCKEHPAVKAPCFSVHGRLRAYAGGPPVNAIWIVGTKRMLGVSDAQALPEFEQMPENVSALLRSGTDVFGDFEFCPFSPDRQGAMRMGCIQAGTHLRTKATRSATADDSVKRWRLDVDSYGPVHIAMTLIQASKALGRELDPGPLAKDEEACFYGREIKEPVLDHVGFMFLNRKLARFDVWGPAIRTKEGAGIGTTEEELRRLYRGARIEPHHYDPSGHYVIVRKGPFEFVFETDGARVTRFRGGETRATALVEGCQ